jgi:hypothetical protein
MSAAGGVEDLDLLLIDGDNLLHDVRGSRDEGAVAWLLPRLAGWRPAHLRIIIALDGHPAPGETSRARVSRGIEFHHSGSRSADDLLIDLLERQPYAGRGRTAVVTRDHGLRARAGRAGGLTRSVDWLMRQVTGTRGRETGRQGKLVGIGQGAPPREHHVGPTDDEAAAAGWRPGRGATRKRGNPKRGPKRSRQR